MCEPSGDIAGGGSATPFEDVEEYLTGFRITEETEGEEPPDDPNFGGIWGDFAGGIVVALVDCDAADLDEITRLGGGSDTVRIIEVPATEPEVRQIVLGLVEQLDAAGVEGDVLVDSTLDGKVITVRVRELSALPNGFGDDVVVPLELMESDDLFTEDGEVVG